MRRTTTVAIGVLLLAATAGLTSSGTLLALSQHELAERVQRTLTLQERVSYQRAIEEAYWRHRIWPKENANPKPSLDAVMSEEQIQNKVKDYLRNSQALEDDWQRPITAQQLQAEMDRMAQNTRQPEVLQELFEALGNDAFVIAECLARPLLAERLLAHPAIERVKQQSRTFNQTVTAGANYTLPKISYPSGGCVEDTWTPTNLTGAPAGRRSHTAVWTGSEMIVWGGWNENSFPLNTGGRYNPSTDSWRATSTTNAPEARVFHTAVWTGSQMIVWGGLNGVNSLNTGGRYNPVTNSWTPTSTTNVPSARYLHTAVWTDTQMVVWGGTNDNNSFNTGGRYNPNTNSWVPISTASVPEGRSSHTAVWTGSEMIVWGGENDSGRLNSGGRYNPSTDNWTATSMGNAPDARSVHTAVWTGSNMIVWGGTPYVASYSGGRYYPNINLWVATSTTNAPSGRADHTAIWTGIEMIIWGGGFGGDTSGGRYCVPSGQPTPTPAPMPCPGGYAVCNGNDNGAGSLRQAIFNASPGDTITFVPSVTTVTLTSGELVIDKNLTITGPGADRLTVQRSPPNGPQFRIFRISSSPVTVSISGITISHGFLQYGPGGGGIFSAGVLTLTDCTISDNNTGDLFSSILGGAGVMNDHGTMTITGCTIANNSASQYDLNATCEGGGILNDSGSLIITNSTISGNSCSAFSPEPLFAGVGSGGGISNRGDLQITSSTIADNSASGNQAYGGGIYGFGSTTTDSSIIALNSAAVGPDFTGAGELQSTGYNIIGNSAGGVINSQPTDQIGINPLLGPLVDNNGPTLTHALQPGSPAMNRGDPAAPPQDQRGYGRLGVPDVGAFEFNGIPPAPVVITNNATNVASFSATLNGSVNPRESTTTVYFQYGLTTSYGSNTPMQTRTGNTVQPVSANIGGLSASTTYHFRIIAHSAGGIVYGSDRTFTTLRVTGPPVVITNPASYVASFSATLNGSVDPHGLSTTVYFQYGTTASYGLTTAIQSKTGNAYQNVSAIIGGLSASTTYHFRIVATNSSGTRYGSDRMFTTLSATGLPVVITNPANHIASFSARINGSVDPHGLTTTVYFQYGTTTSYGLTAAIQSKTGNTYQNVSDIIGGLTASTTYHFRIVATNGAGTRYGSDRTFTTLSPSGPPVAITNPATNVASSSATLNGSVDPHGLTTTVHFQYGTTTNYGHTTANQTKTGNAYQNVTANISGLSASTTYHFRIVVTNTAGTRYGGDRIFRTTP